MRAAAILLLWISMAHAAFEGTVTNRTSGKPQAGSSVTLMKLGAGMDVVGTTKADAQGKFRFDHEQAAGIPYLLQASHDGVNYSKMLQPGTPSTGVQIDVYDASGQAGPARVTQHMILLEPTESALTVSESVIYENGGNTTWYNRDGTFRFYLPPEANGNVRVSAIAPGGLPLNRTAEKGAAPNTYKVDFAVKPGETRFDLSYSLPSMKAFESKVLHGGGPLRVVAPKGVTLTGENLENLGPEPRTQATVYEIKAPEFKLAIEGTGTLRAAAAETPQEDQGPSIEQARPRIYNRLGWVLALVGAILGLGFLLLYRSAKARR